MSVDQNSLPKWTQEEIERLLNVDGVRIAFSVREVAHMMGVNARRLANRLNEKNVPTFWLSQRRMIAVDTVRAIMRGEIDLGEPPLLHGEGGVIVGRAEPAAV